MTTINYTLKAGTTYCETPCPFEETNSSIWVTKVGSYVCTGECPHFVSDDEISYVVTCNHPQRKNESC